MRLEDEEELETLKSKTKKIKNLIIILIVLLSMLCCALVVIIMYRISNPDKITAYIDGKAVPNLDEILDFQTDENGNTQIYIQIRDFASYLNSVNPEFGYQTFKGDFNPKTEEEDKCYIVRKDLEVALFSKKSKVIYKLDLQHSNQEYQECYIDKDVFENNGKLYTSIDGIEKGYNISFSYNEQKKRIEIYTIDSLVSAYKKDLEGKTIGNYGNLSIDSNTFEDSKSVFENLLIVESSSNNKFGIVRTDDYSSWVLEPQYDKINYISGSSAFLVESNGKVGLFSKEGKRKINLIYDQITSMGQNSKLYLVKSQNTYGVVDENGRIVIHPEYEEIGVDVSKYSYNGVKNGYILLNSLIPVCQERKWAFFNTKGEMVTNGFIYDGVGCENIGNVNNIYPLLVIPEYNVIVVRDMYEKYGFMDNTGNDALLQFLFDEMFIKTSSGEKTYWMIYKQKEYDALKYLKQIK